MNPYESNVLMKKYNVCPECGNDKIGGNPSQGTINIEDEVFTRSCKCGWKVIVDRRIKCRAYATFKLKGKTSGVYEVSIHGQGRKYLPVKELKELSGVKRVDHTSKIEEWLNSSEGRKWALEVKPARIP
ncbi:DUF3797 domain-containing protein [Brevibacillus laterosporus]|uniref:DUF3797 domain-containing protein n=1 Tax=Brevibacillus laterosporus TaxID=1465 RepID=A0AAP3DCI6_BRELA|nr:DUF3797 domain-containing protein [Brevibacillus laterosporus]MBG9773549.1 hypothetical protein [Brevibacillus laterosporus]MCR8978713.1 DUF3797 domain-containing protein [Brevibacillus laterosporus]MCZ0805869.1 DUF3797 domain-containing protein [Brevibacillus laterosporus]MCZ0824365.1 DUF3797 domain-containing protein [Brevibacillus laterosporus]MCZ0848269.1 DUF3797 domain-containing protein [Brevibacillus laterosporus]